jgi:broad-specificity NMP kinase
MIYRKRRAGVRFAPEQRRVKAQAMGVRNYLIEGVSGTGKSSVCDELRRRGFHAVNGDQELACRGDPVTGEPFSEAEQDFQAARRRGVGSVHAHHIWRVDKVRAQAADRSREVTFFCGGSRNFAQFIDLFDAVFVLEVDLGTLNRRLAARSGDEWGSTPAERALVLRAHATKEDTPQNAVSIDATAPLARVVDDILARCGDPPPRPSGG